MINGKYFVCFDEFGDIESICSEKLPECKDKICGEFILKLIPIKRHPQETASDELKKALDNVKRIGRFDTKFDKVVKEFRRIL